MRTYLMSVRLNYHSLCVRIGNISHQGLLDVADREYTILYSGVRLLLPYTTLNRPSNLDT